MYVSLYAMGLSLCGCRCFVCRVVCCVVVVCGVAYIIVNGRIAQSVERSANNAVVLGSSPSMTISLLQTHPTLPYHL